MPITFTTLRRALICGGSIHFLGEWYSFGRRKNLFCTLHITCFNLRYLDVQVWELATVATKVESFSGQIYVCFYLNTQQTLAMSSRRRDHTRSPCGGTNSGIIDEDTRSRVAHHSQGSEYAENTCRTPREGPCRVDQPLLTFFSHH